MGNRAIIKGKNSDIGLYVHWNGGYDSILAFTTYCKIQKYRGFDFDASYAMARLTQVVANFFGGGLSVGLMSVPSETTSKHVSEMWLDNGVYELDGWDVVKHYGADGELVYDEISDIDMETLIEFVEYIDSQMPIREQIRYFELK